MATNPPADPAANHHPADHRANHRGSVNRLRRIEGQVRGLTQMIEDDRYCIDILHQIQAVKAALGKVESQVLKDHAGHCVAAAIASGDEKDQQAKFGELIDLFEKVKR